MEQDFEVWHSEYELRQFIHSATRTVISGVIKHCTNDNPYSIFDYDVKNARLNFEMFSVQLRERLTRSENWKAIGIDLEDRFLRGINHYIAWYFQNEPELENFKPNCPYQAMLGFMESTKAEILKYFPELEDGSTPHKLTEKKHSTRYTAKHHVLAYLIECNAKGESYPIGQKKELEKIGNERIGSGKGNRFYKVFNDAIKKDLNVESNLIEIGGDNWREIIKELSNEPDEIEKYLKSKHL